MTFSLEDTVLSKDESTNWYRVHYFRSRPPESAGLFFPAKLNVCINKLSSSSLASSKANVYAVMQCNANPRRLYLRKHSPPRNITLLARSIRILSERKTSHSIPIRYNKRSLFAENQFGMISRRIATIFTFTERTTFTFASKNC